MNGAGQHLLDRRQHVFGVGMAGLHGHHELRNRVGPSGRRTPQPAVRNEVGELVPLLFEAHLLVLAEYGTLTLMPAQSASLRNQDRSQGVGPPTELDVLRAPLGERLVESAHSPEEVGRHREVPPGHHPEDIVGVRGQVVGQRHAAFDPLGPLDGPPLEEIGERAGPLADGGGVDARDVGMAAEPERQQVAGGVVPSGMGGEPIGLGHHVAIEERQDAAAGGAGSVVAGPGQPEAQVRLVDHADLQGRRPGQIQRGIGAVVHHDYFEQLAGVGLALETGQGQGERLRRLVVGDHDSDGNLRLEDLDRCYGQRPPVVVPHSGRGWNLHLGSDCAVTTRKSPTSAKGSSKASPDRKSGILLDRRTIRSGSATSPRRPSSRSHTGMSR